MKEITVQAYVGADQCADGKKHKGKRVISIPGSLKDLPAFIKAQAEVCKSKGMDEYGEAALLEDLISGNKLRHQRDMGKKLREAFGKPTEGTKATTVDLSDVPEL